MGNNDSQPDTKGRDTDPAGNSVVQIFHEVLNLIRDLGPQVASADPVTAISNLLLVLLVILTASEIFVLFLAPKESKGNLAWNIILLIVGVSMVYCLFRVYQSRMDPALAKA